MPRNRATAAAITTLKSISSSPKVKSPFSYLISLQSLLHSNKTLTLLKNFSTDAARADYYNETYVNSNFSDTQKTPNRTAFHQSPNNGVHRETQNPSVSNNQADQDRNFEYGYSNISNGVYGGGGISQNSQRIQSNSVVGNFRGTEKSLSGQESSFNNGHPQKSNGFSEPTSTSIGIHNQPNSTVDNYRRNSEHNLVGESSNIADGYLRNVTGFYRGGDSVLSSRESQGGHPTGYASNSRIPNLWNQECSVGLQRNHDGGYAGSSPGELNQHINGYESQLKPNLLNKEFSRKFQQNPNATYASSVGGFDKNANAYQVQQNENGHYAQGNLGFRQIPNVLHSGGSSDSMMPYYDNSNNKPAPSIVGTIEELDGFCKENKLKEAVEVLELLEKNGIAVDTPRYVWLVQMCGDVGALNYAKSVHGHIIRSAAPTNVSNDNKILEMYIKCGSITDAYEVFEKMPARNMTSWDTMITGLAECGHGEDAIDLFSRFKEAGLKPDGQMFMSVFYACSVLCDVDEGLLHFESMSKEFHIIPSMEHYTSVVKMLASVGYLDEAKEFIEKMPIEPSVDVWETLMNISRLHGNIELRDHCSNVINVMDPSHLTGKSEEVVKYSDLVEEKKKQRLSDSLADVTPKVNQFKAGDKSHPDSDKVYSVLRGMRAQMIEVGYVPVTKFVLHDVDEESKEEAIFTHSEKLAVAQGLVNSPVRAELRIMKNLRICGDCHQAMKIVSKLTGRRLIIRDNKRFHHFENGVCSCKEFW